MSRRHILAVSMLAVGTLVVTAVADLPTRLIWNATASAPIGFYTVAPADALEVPELVAIMPSEPLERFMVDRGYIGRGVPLLKRVLGLPGQRVCRNGATITVDHVEMGGALERDRMGRDLPVWQGCLIIGDGELFLMNWDIRDSLDGRYFGPVPASSVIGRALRSGPMRKVMAATNGGRPRIESTPNPPTQETYHATDRSIYAGRIRLRRSARHAHHEARSRHRAR